MGGEVGGLHQPLMLQALSYSFSFRARRLEQVEKENKELLERLETQNSELLATRQVRHNKE
jgi:hypothetical protein